MWGVQVRGSFERRSVSGAGERICFFVCPACVRHEALPVCGSTRPCFRGHAHPACVCVSARGPVYVAMHILHVCVAAMMRLWIPLRNSFATYSYR